MNIKCQCPEWLSGCGGSITESYSSIAMVAERLWSKAAEGYEYAHPSQNRFNAFTDGLIRDGLIIKSGDGQYRPGAKDQIFVDRTVTSSTNTIALLHQNSVAYRTMGTLMAADRIAVAKLLSEFVRGICGGDVLIPFICARCAIEHAAQLHRLISDIKKCDMPADFESANKLLGELYTKVLEKSYATKVDWEKLAKNPDSISKGLDRESDDGIGYEPAENRMDRTAKGLLNAVDLLNKVIPGVRPAYEILCEFTHPNVGTILSCAETVNPSQDGNGVVWVSKRLGMAAPVPLVEAFPGALDKMFQVISSVSIHYEALDEAAREQREKILAISQQVLRPLVRKCRPILDPYMDCPCCSGKKLRFCCMASG